MNADQVLLQEVSAHPDDDLPRLVLADWWDEYGSAADRARAELIRLQVDRAVPEVAQTQARLPARERDLLTEHRALWRQALPGMEGVHWADEFVRGFVEEVTVSSPDLFLRHAPLLFAAAPLRVVRIHGVHERAELEQVLHSPWLERVCELDLGNNALSREAATALSGFPPLGRLRTLLLHNANLLSHGAEALTRAPGLSALTELYLSGNGITDEGVAHLARYDRFPSLRLLDLRDNEVGSAGLRQLALAPPYQGLTDLWLVNNEMGDEGVLSLCGPEASPRIPRLRSLWLNFNPLSDRAAISLAGDPARSTLRDLDLRHCHIHDEGALALACSPHLLALDYLQLTGNALGTQAVSALRARFGRRVRV